MIGYLILNICCCSMSLALFFLSFDLSLIVAFIACIKRSSFRMSLQKTCTASCSCSMTAQKSCVKLLSNYVRAQKSGSNLLSAFLSEFFFLSALLSTQKHTQGTSEPLCCSWGNFRGRSTKERLRPCHTYFSSGNTCHCALA